MRKVKVAKSAGFCFGVKRAIDMVYEEAAKGGKVYIQISHGSYNHPYTD